MNVKFLTRLYSTALLVATLSGVSILTTKDASACTADDAYVGSICSVAANWCPRSYLPADGRTLSVTNNEFLYAVIQNQFGGTKGVDFKLPDLRGVTPVSEGDGLPVGTRRGSQTVTLTQEQLPEHRHLGTIKAGSVGEADLYISPVQATQSTPSLGGYLAAPSYGAFIESDKSTDTAPLGGASSPAHVYYDVSTGVTGASQPVPVESPFTVIQYCIRVKGLFP